MNQEQLRLNIDLKKTQEVACEECNHNVFQEGLMLRKASKFLAGTEKDALIPLPVFSCAKCSHVNVDFLPEALKEIDGN